MDSLHRTFTYLVGISALDTSSIIDYFDFIKILYIFFTPPRRWNIMKKQLSENHIKYQKECAQQDGLRMLMQPMP